jgi:predicted TIM-barrel fold metal-dependent hydrolase
MIVDCHSHLYPPAFQNPAQPAEGIFGTMFDPDGLIARQDEAGVDLSVVSSPMIFGPGTPVDPLSLGAIRVYNDFVAELQARYPRRIAAMASAFPFGDEAHVRETERAIRDAGLRGVAVNSSVDGEYLDSERATPFFDLIAQLGCPVFVHPPGGSAALPLPKALTEAILRPFDTTICIGRLAISGFFERYPHMRLIFGHVGGAIPMLLGRLDCSYTLREDRSFGDWGMTPPPQPPSSYIRKMYVDTVSWHPPAVRCAVESLGADHVLLGSDFPPVALPLAQSVRAVTDLGLPPAETEQILGGNAQRLFRLQAGDWR